MPTTTRPPIKKVFAASRSIVTAAVNLTVPPRQSASGTSQCCCPTCAGLECLDRTRFFSGQLLTEADLNNEQSYWLAKSRLHNRFLHGSGVVCGMQVVCGDCDGWVTVKPGYAIDPCGNDLIVCSDQPFNVIKAIQACCTPTKQTGNCAPLRSTPPANCQGTTQTWCITIEYQEQASRLVTPLKQATPKSGACSCVGSKGSCGCGCGCGGHGNNASTSSATNGCSCNSTTMQSPAVPAGACEPTRINEGFRLCVVPAPPSEETPRDLFLGPQLINWSNAFRKAGCSFSKLRRLAAPTIPTASPIPILHTRQFATIWPRLRTILHPVSSSIARFSTISAKFRWFRRHRPLVAISMDWRQT